MNKHGFYSLEKRLKYFGYYDFKQFYGFKCKSV